RTCRAAVAFAALEAARYRVNAFCALLSCPLSLYSLPRLRSSSSFQSPSLNSEAYSCARRARSSSALRFTSFQASVGVFGAPDLVVCDVTLIDPSMSIKTRKRIANMFEQPPQDDRPIVLFANLTQEATQGLSSGGRAAAYNVDSILPVERRSIAAHLQRHVESRPRYNLQSVIMFVCSKRRNPQ